MVVLWLAGSAVAAEPSRTADEWADRFRRSGSWATAGGATSLVAGVLVLSVGRPPGELSDETQSVSDLRGLSGGVLLVGGLTSGLIGLNHLSESRAWREQAERDAVKVSWSVGPGSVGVGLTF
ncbi:MAG: hypothetical protein ABMA64_41905 [Myxococcota bacterium]